MHDAGLLCLLLGASVGICWHLLRWAVCKHRIILLPSSRQHRKATEPSACRHRVKFWFIKNYMSPQMKSFVPHMAAAYGFEYQFVTYKWPSWLHKQVRPSAPCSVPCKRGMGNCFAPKLISILHQEMDKCIAHLSKACVLFTCRFKEAMCPTTLAQAL